MSGLRKRSTRAVIALGAVVLLACGLRVDTPVAATTGASIDLVPPGPVAQDEVVTLVGSGFVPGETVLVLQCYGTAPACYSLQRSEHAPDAAGSFTTRVQVRVHEVIPGFATCRRYLQCYLLATGSVSGDSPAVPLTFDDSFHTDAAAVVEPRGALESGRTVTVHGSNFAPYERISLKQCYVQDQCVGVAPTVHTTADANGAFDAEYVVHDQLARRSGDPFECAAAENPCVLEVRSRVRDTMRARLRFASLLVAAEPAAGLRDRARVALTGDGWVPGAPVAVHQCLVVVETTRCDAGTIATIASPAGTINTEVEIRDHVVLAGRVHSCRVATCDLQVSQYGVGGPVERVDVQFRGFPASASIITPGPHAPGSVVQIGLDSWPAGDRVEARFCWGGICGVPGPAVLLPTGSGSIEVVLSSAPCTVSAQDIGASCEILVQSVDHRGYERSLRLSSGPAGWPGVVGWWTAAVESDGEVCVPVVLRSPAPSDLVIPFVPVDEQAVAGRDYEGRSGSITIARGSSLGCARVRLIDDDRADDVEVFAVRLLMSPSAAVGAVPIAASPAYAFVKDDD